MVIIRVKAVMSISQRIDVTIVGAGLVGATLALGCARQGMRVALIDKLPLTTQLAQTFDGRASAIALTSQRLFAHLNLWEKIAFFAQPICDIRVADKDSTSFVHYDHTDIGDNPFGWIVENRYIRQALAEAVHAHPNITAYMSQTIKTWKQHTGYVEVILEDNTNWKSSVMIAADGKGSPIRTQLGIRTLEKQYTQTALVCTIAHAKPHHGLAVEWFLPAGPFAILPLQKNRSSLVWTEPHARAKQYLQLSEAEITQEIQERVGGYLGQVTLEVPCFAYPLSYLHAHEYGKDRVWLIGDAAHAIHPIAGQGVNLGFRDVAVLLELWNNQCALGLDIGSNALLTRYQQWRRFDNTAMLFITDGLNHLFSNDLLPIKLARRAGLWAVEHAFPLKSLFMQHAMGLTGDVPKVMQDPYN